MAVPVGRPGLVWTDSAYLALVRADTMVGIQQIVDGQLGELVPFAIATQAQFAVGDSFAWSGTTLGIAYLASGAPTLALFDPDDGSVATIPLAQVSAASRARVVWRDDRLAVAWLEGDGVHLREVDSGGGPLGSEIVLGVVAAVASRPPIQMRVFAGELTGSHPLRPVSATRPAPRRRRCVKRSGTGPRRAAHRTIQRFRVAQS